MTAAGMTVTILSPANGALLVQNPPVPIVVKWCSSGASSIPTHNVFVDGVLVGGAIVGPAPSGCTAGGTTAVSSSPSFGSHTVTAQGRDSQNRSASATSSFTLQQPVSLIDYRPEVTPDARSVEVPLGAAVRDSFTIRNAGTRTAQYQLAASCAGAPCTSSPSTLTLTPGALGYFRVNYTTPGTSGQGVTLSATATYQDASLGTISDAGDVTATTASPAALYQPTVVPVVQATSGTPGVMAGYGFTVTNTGRARATYSLNWWGSFGVETTPPPDGTWLILDSGQSTRYNVAAKAPPDGQTGHLWFEATVVYGGEEIISATDKMSITGLTTQRTVVVRAPNGNVQLIQPGLTPQVVPFLITNVTGVDRTVTYTSTCTGAATSCRYSELGGAVAEQTATIAPGVQQSVNVFFDVGAESQATVRLQAYETAAPTNIDEATVTLSRNPLPGGVRVNAVGIQTARNTNETFTQHFYIVNASTAAMAFTYASSTTGTVFASCTGSGVTAALQPGDSTDVSVQCVTVSTHGRSGAVGLSASNESSQASASVPTTTALMAGADVNVHDVNAGASIAREQCLTIAVGDNSAYECGQLRVVHPLPSTTTMGQTFTPTLVHTNHNVELVNANVTFGPNIVPYRIAARVYNVASNVGDTPVSFDWRPEWSNGMPRRIVVPFTVWNLNMNASGAYRYRLDVQVFTPDSTFTISDTSTFASANRLVSPFGALWWLDGLERLRFTTPYPNQILWVGGDGSTRLYAKATNPDRPTWFAIDTLDRPDSITVVGSIYKRYLRGGAWVEFDPSGLHTATVNSRGHRTILSYAGDLLTTITLPTPPGGVSRTYTFAYGGNPLRLTSVTAPAVGTVPRQVTIADSLDQFGLPHITAIRDPDTLVTRFEYANWPMSARIDKRGVRTTFDFNYEMLRRATIHMESAADDIVHTFCAAEWSSASTWAGLNPCAPEVLSADSVRTWVDGPRSDVQDTTAFYINRFGAPERIVDALGQRTLIERADSKWPLLVTKVTDPRDHVVSTLYDPVTGLPNAITSVRPSSWSAHIVSDDARTSILWDAKWERPTSMTDPTGRISKFEYDPITGSLVRQWLGNDQAQIVSFDYYPQTRLLRTVTTLQSPNPTVYEYDGQGNLSQITTPRGLVTTIGRDLVGRASIVRTPITEAPTSVWRYQAYTFDAMDRVLTVVDSAPTIPGSQSWQSVHLTIDYDPVGNAKSVRRTMFPDNLIGEIANSYEFDGANRVVRQYDPYRSTDQTTARLHYDPAGNTRMILRGGTVIVDGTDSSEFDALNRPVRRLISRPGGSPDDQRFAYDAASNLISATNANAEIGRVYTIGGQLAVDSTRIANTDLSFGSHTYVQSFTYDLAGRRLTMTPPAELANLGILASQSYDYDEVTGALVAVTSNVLGAFRYFYNRAGLVDSVQAPNGTRQSFIYDDEARLSQRSEFGLASAPFHNDTYQFDARNKLLAAQSTTFGTPITRSAVYGGLGSVLYANGPQTESYSRDPLGNVLSRSIVAATWAGTYQNQYQQHSTRLTTIGGSPALGQTDSVFRSYDGSGNTTRIDRRVFTCPTRSECGPADMITATSSLTNFYSGDGQLTAARLQTSNDDLGQPGASDNVMPYGAMGRGVLEEYRYDALGRRVWRRAHRDPYCIGVNPTLTPVCASTVERTIFDGDQILAEIREPASDSSAVGETDSGSDGQYGVVGYLHGGAMDTPLALSRRWTNGITHLVLHRDSHGNIDAATIGAGPNVGRLIDCDRPGALLPQEGCRKIRWPGLDMSVGFQRPTSNVGDSDWWGTLIGGNQNATGIIHMRARQFDPQSGTFMQADPAGMGGGLNPYAFGGGDAVNFSDPSGMCAEGQTERMHFTRMDGDMWGVSKDCLTDEGWRGDLAWGYTTTIGVGAALYRAFGRAGAFVYAGAMLAPAEPVLAGIGAGELAAAGGAIGTLRAGYAVIGNYPTYVSFGRLVGANIYNVPNVLYDAMVWYRQDLATSVNLAVIRAYALMGNSFRIVYNDYSKGAGMDLKREVAMLLGMGMRQVGNWIIH